jgi:hypothetical protein
MIKYSPERRFNIKQNIQQKVWFRDRRTEETKQNKIFDDCLQPLASNS